MKQKMVIMDLDGTLLRKDKSISEYTRRVIGVCKNSGIKVVFATARPERTTSSYMRMLNPDAVVSNNGAKIACLDKVIQLREIKPSSVIRIVSRLLEKKMFICLDYETYSLTNCPDYLEWNNWNAIYTPDFASFEPSGVQKISVRATQLDLFSSINFKDLGCAFYANQSDNWYMIIDSNASKAKAIDNLLAYYGIQIEDTVAFGDDQNDLEMLQKCGTGVAMANSIQQLKNHADYICPSNEDDGVAVWIENNLISTNSI